MTENQATEFHSDVQSERPLTRAELRRGRFEKKRRGGLASRVGNALIWIVGVLGGLVLLWEAVAALMGLSLVVLVTGSMTPTMPAGTVAVVQEVPATEVAVGDVVTVPRAGSSIPVTHRVVDVEVRDQRVSLTLRGDANPVADPLPYELLEVKKVLAAAPGAGPVASLLLSPGVRLGLVFIIAIAIAIVLWPRGSSAADTEPHNERIRP